VGEMRNAYKILVGNLKESDHLESQRVDRRIILEYILGKYFRRLWIGFIWLRIGTSGRLFLKC
jgi:hypothetical protein